MSPSQMLKTADRRCRTQRAWSRQKLRIFVVLLCSCLRLSAQTGPAAIASAEVRQLAAEQRWQDIALLLGPLRSRSADLNFYYGTALARLERWHEAEIAFQSGLRLAPHDPRFPIELAGVAFRQKHYPQAARRLRQALKLTPQDTYANDFLGTIYFLQGNLEASLKYWNRVGKPQVVESRADPLPQVSPALLDRAFAFAPASMLPLPEFRATGARIRSLGIFPRYQFDLRAREDDKVDVWFRSQERNGFGSTKWEGWFLLLRGLPFLSVNPEYYNLRHEAINLVSLFRWDPQKRRVFAQFSSPFQHSAKYRYEIAADLRNENWAILNSAAPPSSPLASLNLRREVLGFSLASHASGEWHWSAGVEISHRDFRNVVSGPVLTRALLAKGYQLRQLAELGATFWRMPERRFTVDAEVSSQAARLWSQPEESSEKLQGSLGWHWFPRAEGDDYEMQQQFRSGKTFGTVPFDGLFMLGLERDNNLPMRAHIGTRDGRKGSAPLGRNYFLATWETDKNLYGNGIAALKMGPFLDTGKITGPFATLGSHKWLWDTGAQIKLRVFGTGVAFSFGKDLRSGNNAFYLTMLR
jgi:tetratricopeptide (TPR) repeat protein